MDDNDSLSEETRLYLEGARHRVEQLAPVADLRAKVEQVELPFREPTRRVHGKFVPGVVNTVEENLETLIEPLSINEQRKVRRLTRRTGARVPVDMHRHPDHDTSVIAAETVEPYLTALQETIYKAFIQHGAMNDETLEELPEIVALDLGKTTARRRRTDLARMGKLVVVGRTYNSRGNPMNLYDIPNRTSTSHATRP